MLSSCRRAVIVGSPPQYRGTDIPGRDIELLLLKYFPGVALFIEKPVSTGPHGLAMEIGRQIQEAGNICSVGWVSLKHEDELLAH